MTTLKAIICWKGATGVSVTVTDSGGYLLCSTGSHYGGRTGLSIGMRFIADTLPTGISDATTYYSGYVSDTSFYLYDTKSNALAGGTTGRIVYSTSGSGVFAKSAFLLENVDATKYGGSSATDYIGARVYDALGSFNTAMSASDGYSVDCEIVEPFDSVVSGSTTINLYSNGCFIHASGDANSNGVVGSGFRHISSVASPAWLLTLGRNIGVFGFTLAHTVSSGYLLNLSYPGSYADSMLLLNTSGDISGASRGVTFGAGARLVRSLIIGHRYGLYVPSAVYGFLIANNVVSKCNNGIYSTGIYSTYGYYFNNIALGNTVNWTANLYTPEGADRNAGLSSDTTWVKTGKTKISMTTADFIDPSNDNYRAVSAVSPQVDVGVTYQYFSGVDIAGNESPSYNNGGSEGVDVGAFEYDNGYGGHPATAFIVLTNIVSGTRILITRDDTGATLYNDVPGTSLSFETGYIGAFSLRARKASASPFYREFAAGGITVADQTTSIKLLQQLDE